MPMCGLWLPEQSFRGAKHIQTSHTYDYVVRRLKMSQRERDARRKIFILSVDGGNVLAQMYILPIWGMIFSCIDAFVV